MLEIIFVGMFVGLISAYGMNWTMQAISKNHAVPVDMARVIGGMIVENKNYETKIGLAIHLAIGALLGAVYFLVFNLLGMTGAAAIVSLSLGAALLQGLFFSYSLMFFVEETHPKQKYRRATLVVGAIYNLGHVVFGIICGIGAALFF